MGLELYLLPWELMRGVHRQIVTTGKYHRWIGDVDSPTRVVWLMGISWVGWLPIANWGRGFHSWTIVLGFTLDI